MYEQFLERVLAVTRLVPRRGLRMLLLAVILTILANVRRLLHGSDSLRFFVSSLLYNFGSTPRVDQRHLRNAFVDTPSVDLSSTKRAHTHPSSARTRSSATETMRAIARSVGLETYVYQMGTSDQRNGLKGSRLYFWIKDLPTEPRNFSVGDGDVLTMVDVDYYVDMPSLLAKEFRPFLIRTLQPKVVAEVGKEVSFTFDADGVIDYIVSGGGTYRHEVWNYQQDHVKVVYWKYWLWPVVATYLVERRPNGDNVDIVLLAPLKKFEGILGFLANFLLEGKPLTRLKPYKEGYNMLHVRDNNQHAISLGVPGEFNSVLIPVSVYDTAMNVARVTKTELTPASVESFCGVEDKLSAKFVSAVVTRHVRAKQPIKPLYVFPVAEGVRRYQFGTYEPDAKPSLTPFMSPIIHAAYAPDMTAGNEARAIKSRITDIAVKDEAPTPFMLRVMDEFITKLIPVPHYGVPVGNDEVYARQDTRVQQSILNEAQGWARGFRDRVSSFVKREAYATPNDPRVISTLNPRVKMDYSAYIYSLSEMLKDKPWYAFSKTPKEIACRVADILGRSDGCTESDYSRYDGHLDAKARLLERLILLRFFKTCYHNDLLDLHEKTHHLPANGRFGNKYETENARNSGEPGTSAFNTLVNVFIAFLAFRMERGADGQFLCADVAWKRVDLFYLAGGDDGLCGNAPSNFTKAASSMGQVLETTNKLRGDAGVMFLARVFGPKVWYGDPTSMCDIVRQLSKLHTTPSLPDSVPAVQKLLEKASSFFLSDAHTPVIGDYCALVLRAAAEKRLTRNAQCAPIRKWWDKYDSSEQWPNDGDWFLEFLMFQTHEMGNFGWMAWDSWIELMKRQPLHLTKLLSPPLCMEIRNEAPKATAVVDGNIHHVKPKKLSTPPSAGAVPRPLKPRLGKGPRKGGQ